MTYGETQRIRYWLTPAGCQALGGHRPNPSGTDCTTCGAAITTDKENR